MLDQFETRRSVFVKERFFALLIRMTAAASVILNDRLCENSIGALRRCSGRTDKVLNLQ